MVQSGGLCPDAQVRKAIDHRMLQFTPACYLERSDSLSSFVSISKVMSSATSGESPNFLGKTRHVMYYGNSHGAGHLHKIWHFEHRSLKVKYKHHEIRYIVGTGTSASPKAPSRGGRVRP